MPYEIHQLPYTDLHSLNLDILFKKIKQLEDQVKNLSGEADKTADVPTIRELSPYTRAHSEIKEVIESYIINNEKLFYDNATALNISMSVDADGKMGIDCSTFAALCILGCKFKDSRYQKQLDAGQSYRDDNKPSYEWGSDIYSGAINVVNNVPEYARYANDLARYYAMKKRLYVPLGDLSNAMPGDMIFWVGNWSADDIINDAPFMNITHVALYMGPDGDGGAQIVDANTGRSGGPVAYSSLTQSDIKSGTYLFARPDFNGELTHTIDGSAYLPADLNVTNVSNFTLKALGGSSALTGDALIGGTLAHSTDGGLRIEEPGYYAVTLNIATTSASAGILAYELRLFDLDASNGPAIMSGVHTNTASNVAAKTTVTRVMKIERKQRFMLYARSTGTAVTLASGETGTSVQVTKIK